MRKKISFGLLLFLLLGMASPCQAGWMWTPESGKWTNPKKASKDAPEDQFAWAMTFYNQRKWDRAVEEFEKIPDNFPTSHFAAEAVYYVGMSWEEREDLAKAADAYQKLVDRYPYSDRIKDAVKQEFTIANEFASGTKIKIWGIPALSGQDKAIELYQHIVKNAPFGSYGAEAQFAIGEVYKKLGNFEDSQKAYQSVVDDYPQSDLVSKARYQIAAVSMEASKQSHSSEQYAERAIEEFEGFKNSFPDDTQAVEADESIKMLRAKKAMTQFDTAAFYEKQKKIASAKFYYQEIVGKYPETPAAAEARKRLDKIIQAESGGPKPSKPWYKIW